MPMSRESSFRVLTVAVLGLCYAVGLPSTLTECDSGEFVALALRGGIAHPPGYPLYTMLLRAVALIASTAAPVATLAAASAACAVAGAGLLFGALRIVAPQPEWRAAAVIVAGTAEPAWRGATSIEPFGLHLLLVGAALAATSACFHHPSRRWPRALLGLTFGLGLCHHHTLVLLAPLGAAALLFGGASVPSSRVRDVLAFAVGFVLGCAPLLYFVVVDKSGPYVWGDWESVGDGLWQHLRRDQYGSTALIPGANGPWWSVPVHFVSTSLQHFSFVWFAVVVAGFAAVARVRRDFALGFAFTCAAVFWFLAVCRLDPPIAGLPRVVVERFFSMPDLVLAFPLAAALAAGADRVRFLRPLTALFVVVHVAAQAPTSMRSGERVDGAHLEDVARAVRAHEVVFTENDADFMGALYLQATGLDIDVVQVPLLRLPSYRRRVRAALWPRAPDNASVGALVDHLLASGRPVSLTSAPPGAGAFLERSYPFGPLIRLVPPGQELPGMDLVVRWNAQFADGSALLARARQQRSIEPWSAAALSNAHRTWRSLVGALSEQGQSDALVDARRRLDEIEELERRLRFRIADEEAPR